MTEEQINAFLAMDHPWSTPAVLGKLIEAAEHLLHAHDCDAEGWEEVSAAVKHGRERLEALGFEVPKRFAHASMHG